MPDYRKTRRRIAILQRDVREYEEELEAAVAREDIPAAKRLRELIFRTEQLIEELMEE